MIILIGINNDKVTIVSTNAYTKYRMKILMKIISIPSRILQHVSHDDMRCVTVVVTHPNETSPYLIFTCNRFYQGG